MEQERKKSLSVTFRIIATTVGILVAVVALNYVIFATGYRNDAENAMVEKAAAFTAVADEAKNHAAKLFTNGSVDVESLIKETQAHVESGGSYADTRVFDTIPVVVGWTTAREAAAREGIDFAVPAFEARNPENEPKPGTFRAELLQKAGFPDSAPTAFHCLPDRPETPTATAKTRSASPWNHGTSGICTEHTKSSSRSLRPINRSPVSSATG